MSEIENYYKDVYAIMYIQQYVTDMEIIEVKQTRQ